MNLPTWTLMEPEYAIYSTHILFASVWTRKS